MDAANSNHSALFSTGLNKLWNSTGTMRKSILLACIIVLAFCAWLLFHHTKEPITNSSQEAQTALTNRQSLNQPSQSVIPKPLPAPITQTPAPHPTPLTSNELEERAIAEWEKPIEFYGKVVDENTNPVQGATIQFQWSGRSDKVFTAATESDAAGLFSLHGKHGRSLDVSVGKKGYYSSRRDKTGFLYSLGPDIYSPEEWNPVIFHLRKKGEGASLVGLKRNYRIPRDGTPVSINLTTGATATSESGDFVVRCWTQDAGKRSGEKYDWRCVVSIPGGGAITNNDEFPFEAPEKGYVPSLEIAMPANVPDWRDTVELKFYYHLANGLYGRMTFTMVAFNQHFCMIDSALNPTGSRNLEPK
jgi:hypothetical protein